MPSFTFGDLQTRVYDRLDNNGLLYPSAEILMYANEAQRVLNAVTGLLQTTLLVPGQSVARRVWYDVPIGILIPLRVQFEGQYLYKSSLVRMGELTPNWTQESSATAGFPPSRWVPLGLSKFGIHPSDANGGATISVTGILEPTLFTSASSPIPFPDEYIEALEELTTFSIQLKEGFPLFRGAEMLYKKFLSKTQQEARWRNLSMPTYRDERKSPN